MSSPSPYIPVSSEDALQEVREVLRIQESALKVLTEQIPTVNELMVESFENISGEFIAIASKAREINGFCAQLQEDESQDASLVEEIRTRNQTISDAIQQLIMAMQFQDRVSQNMVIVENVLRSMMEKMSRETSYTEHSFVTHESAIRHAKEILAMLNLGEIRQPFVKLLMEDHVITDGEDIGYMPANPEQDFSEDAEDDIELF